MFATAITLAVIGFSIKTLIDLAKQDGAKAIAAIQGRSWAATPRFDQPVLVRFNSTRRAETPAWQAELSAAA